MLWNDIVLHPFRLLFSIIPELFRVLFGSFPILCCLATVLVCPSSSSVNLSFVFFLVLLDVALLLFSIIRWFGQGAQHICDADKVCRLIDDCADDRVPGVRQIVNYPQSLLFMLTDPRAIATEFGITHCLGTCLSLFFMLLSTYFFFSTLVCFLVLPHHPSPSPFSFLLLVFV